MGVLSIAPLCSALKLFLQCFSGFFATLEPTDASRQLDRQRKKKTRANAQSFFGFLLYQVGESVSQEKSQVPHLRPTGVVSWSSHLSGRDRRRTRPRACPGRPRTRSRPSPRSWSWSCIASSRSPRPSRSPSSPSSRTRTRCPRLCGNQNVQDTFTVVHLGRIWREGSAPDLRRSSKQRGSLGLKERAEKTSF